MPECYRCRRAAAELHPLGSLLACVECLTALAGCALSYDVAHGRELARYTEAVAGHPRRVVPPIAKE